MSRSPSALGSPLAFALACVCVLELGARFFDPYRQVPHASLSSVNRAVNRGWSHYVAPRQLEKPLVTLISNSQAVARDLPIPERRYPALLRETLGESAVLENWSVPGIRSGEVEILTAQAARREAALTVYVLGYFNFDRRAPALRGGNSDIHVLIGEPGFWPFLGELSIAPRIQWSDLADQLAVSSIALVHGRSSVIDWMARQVDQTHHRAIFGAEIFDRDPPARPMRRGRMRFLEPGPKAQDFLDAEAQASTDKRFASFLALLPQLKARREHVLFVVMPIRRDRRQKRLLDKAFRFNAGVAARLRREGIAVLEWGDLVPGELFLTRSHLNTQGHEIMARALEPEIRRALRH